MYFKETLKIFLKGPKIELLSLIVGLTVMLTIANIKMPNWIWLLALGFMILCSSMFRFITVDEEYYHNDQFKLTQNNIIDYVISKNLFVIFFVSLIIGLVLISSLLLQGDEFDINRFGQVIIYCLFVIGSENILLSFHNKPVEGYASGLKRNEVEDIRVGWLNFKNQIPSFFIIGLFCILFFVLKFTPDLFLSVIYSLTGCITLSYFVKASIK
ncbi:hypothetical protein [Amphibacillus indicireducens]|uniref:DUF3169 family protein n=1 Tax=Amphibacillus indicireducens TaxID=1076330 RepID=A0ABP7V234_9BACI